MRLEPRDLADVQPQIESAGRTIADFVGRYGGTANGWGTQQLAYLTEAVAHLNRAWSLVRAAHGPERTAPGVVTPELVDAMRAVPFSTSIQLDTRPPRPSH